MRCHDILGISERANDTEILAAYSKKMNTLCEVIGTDSPAYTKKLREIDDAKEDCFSWKQKSFSSQTSARFTEMSTSFFSPNRLNAAPFCIGPCSCCDCCCGAGWSSQNDSCCVDCCDLSISGLSPAIFCDVGIYIAMAAGFLIAHSKSREEKRRLQAEEQRKREEAQKAALVATLQSKLRQEEELLETLRRDCTNLREKRLLLNKYSTFFIALSSDADRDPMVNLSPITKMIQEIDRQILDHENRIVQMQREHDSISAQIKANSCN